MKKKYLWEKGEIALRESPLSPTKKEIEHADKILEKAIGRCSSKKKIKV